MRSWRLIQFSFLMLFVELSLIRFTSANFMYLAFFSNYILMASFLGIAAGFLRNKKKFNLFNIAPVFLAVLIYLCYHYQFEYQITMEKAIDDLQLQVSALSVHALPLMLTVPGVFVSVVLVMAAFANGTASEFRKLPPLRAYQLEILGSLLGVIMFTLLAFLQATPITWGLFICLVYISLQWQSWRLKSCWWSIQLMALTVMLTVFIVESPSKLQLWSPYYKVVVKPYSQGRYAVDVNGAPQQFIESVAQRHIYKPFYFYPYQHLPLSDDLANVLIIGAGTGGDVAIALAQGARHVDAVEIDPAMVMVGKKLNPNKPYDDPRVNTYINDGRAFLEQSRKKYNLIIIALADSMTLVTHQSSLRLENYLLTREGLDAARAHLAENGAFAMYNYYRNSWIVDRLGVSLSEIYGHAPCLDTQGDYQHWLSVFTVSNSNNNLQCKSVWEPQNKVLPIPASDNHPFFYMQANELTAMYIASLMFILLVTLLTIKVSDSSIKKIVKDADYFLMGAAFLLLEAKNIVNFALLFGTTWLVNSLVFIGILTTVLVAALFIEHQPDIKHKRNLLFALLLASLIICWLTPNQVLLVMPTPLRLLVASILAFAPVFFANLIFSGQFQQTSHSANAFAANTMGAMVGALFEYSSLITGYQNLLILAALLYTLAIFMMPQFQKKFVATAILINETE